MRTKASVRAAAQKKADAPSEREESPSKESKRRKREVAVKHDDDKQDDEEADEPDDGVQLEAEDIPPKKRIRSSQAPVASTSTAKAKRGRPCKGTSKVTSKKQKDALSVEVEQDEDRAPTIAELENRDVYRTYSKLKVGVDGSKPGVTAADMTFAVGDTCVLRRPDDEDDSDADEWICRIERIRAKDANCVYCVVRWFYTQSQAIAEFKLPKSAFKGMAEDEILACDHMDVVDVLGVDSHVEVTFGASVEGSVDYCYNKWIAGLGSVNKKISIVAMTEPLLAPDSVAKVTLL